MPAAFNVQNDTGTVADANAYVSLDYFKQYHLDRGRTFTLTDDAIQAGIVRSTDYVDGRFGDRFAGSPLTDTQTTQFPRQCAYYDSGRQIEGIPVELKKAIAEYALRASTGELLMDAPRPVGDDGEPAPTGKIASLSQTVGPVSETKTYATTSGRPGAGSALVDGTLMPEIPAADLLIEKLLDGSGFQRRVIRT